MPNTSRSSLPQSTVILLPFGVILPALYRAVGGGELVISRRTENESEVCVEVIGKDHALFERLRSAFEAKIEEFVCLLKAGK